MSSEGPAAEGLKKTGLKLPSGPVRSQSEPIDLLALAGPSLAARALPAAAVTVIVGVAASPRPGQRWFLAVLAAGLVAALGKQAQATARGSVRSGHAGRLVRSGHAGR